MLDQQWSLSILLLPHISNEGHSFIILCWHWICQAIPDKILIAIQYLTGRHVKISCWCKNVERVDKYLYTVPEASTSHTLEYKTKTWNDLPLNIYYLQTYLRLWSIFIEHTLGVPKQSSLTHIFELMTYKPHPCPAALTHTHTHTHTRTQSHPH